MSYPEKQQRTLIAAAFFAAGMGLICLRGLLPAPNPDDLADQNYVSNLNRQYTNAREDFRNEHDLPVAADAEDSALDMAQSVPIESEKFVPFEMEAEENLIDSVQSLSPPAVTQYPSVALTPIPVSPPEFMALNSPDRIIATTSPQPSDSRFVRTLAEPNRDTAGPPLASNEKSVVQPVEKIAESRYPLDDMIANQVTDPPLTADSSSIAMESPIVVEFPSPVERVAATTRRLSTEHPATAENQSRFTAPMPVPPSAAPAASPNPQIPDLTRATQFQLAEQPKPGERTDESSPCIDSRAVSIPASEQDFSPDAWFDQTYDPRAELAVYENKTCQPTQRPAIEWFRNWYDRGEIPPSRHWFGKHNPDQFQFILAGDQRLAYASNTQKDDSSSLIAAQTNLDFDLRLTSTERLHWFITPLTQGANSSRWLLDDDRFVSEFNADLLFGYFEGDLGAMTGGLVEKTLPFDFPFAIGVMPLVIQNGVWMEDAMLGAAMTIPAQNMPALNISNLDITFFAGFDKVDSPAFEGDDNTAKIWAIMSFIEAWNGYIEADYAYLEDRDTARDRSYHNVGIGYTRRYGLISNSTRVIANAGQSTDGGPNTADGILLLSENSLVSAMPYNVVPYLNLFAGFDRPQSAARQAAAGGVLRNTGILFESDNLTGYPTLDATANQTFGAALGINLLPADFSQQLILETAMLGTMGDDVGRNAAGAQYGLGARYQLPLTNSILIRMDAMAGFLENAPEIHGARIELRQKF